MKDMEQSDVAEWFRRVLEATDARQTAIEQAYLHLRNAGLLSKVTLLKYQCVRGCQLVTVFRLDETTLAAVRDYKYSPGMNLQQSVESARQSKTLDGNRHWPAHVYDVAELAMWGREAGMSVNCRHIMTTLMAQEVMEAVEGISPGRPGKPTRLG